MLASKTALEKKQNLPTRKLKKVQARKSELAKKSLLKMAV
jgi:hypothetical protein